ncbi:hypothetical protein MTR67_030722 [Solanum verrucosum]|uniref:Uncharacterized protein n=1 Tax=Solanum verrucosum TaxID=315347 RepID=A0AAF0ZDT8_SOLVR|nr:hypothetical protein MTR67_030722 [Solanum verrucosum]
MHRYARDKQEMLVEAQHSLRKATKRMKKYADQHQRALEFQVGDEAKARHGKVVIVTSSWLNKLKAKCWTRAAIKEISPRWKAG